MVLLGDWRLEGGEALTALTAAEAGSEDMVREVG